MALKSTLCCISVTYVAYSALLLLPVFLREAFDELQHGAVCHQVQRTLALVVSVADVSPFLR